MQTKEQHRKSCAKHYATHKQYYYLRNKKNRITRRQLVKQCLLCCDECGETDNRVLNFYRPDGKWTVIWRWVNTGVYKQEAMLDLLNSSVLCLNCKRKLDVDKVY